VFAETSAAGTDTTNNYPNDAAKAGDVARFIALFFISDNTEDMTHTTK